MLRSDPSEIAAGHLAAGRVAEAKAIYERALRTDPTHVRALCGLGTIALRGGEVSRALELIGHAVAIAPTDGSTVGNLGVVYLAQNKLAEAEDCFRRALDLEPTQPDLHANFASALLVRGDRQTALKAQRRAVELAPESATQRFNLGNMLVALGRPVDAIEVYEATLAIEPDHVGALNNLSILHKQAGRLDEAEALLDEAQLRDPMNPELMANHADILLQRGHRDQALENMRRAAGLAPANASLNLALGTMLLELGRLTEAGQVLSGATRGAPDNPDIALALGRMLRRQGQLDAAQTAVERAVKLSATPGAAGAEAAELLLMRGRYEEGWARLDELARLAPTPIAEPDLREPSDLAGTEIRLIAADAAASLFAARFIPALVRHGVVATVICPPMLAPLMEALSAVTKVVPSEHLDFTALAGDGVPTVLMDNLPRRLRVDPGYPAADAPVFDVRADASPATSDGRPRKVGIWWEGPGPGPDMLQALSGLDGVQTVSLQSGPLRAYAQDALSQFGIIDQGGMINDFRDLAEAILSVDILVTPDGPVAHLAGSLGVETWVLVGRDGSWYWSNGAQPSPWYPTSRTFRQSVDGTWAAALDAARAALVTPDQSATAPSPTGEPA
ncbi:tetratricopeptide repeat protein [Thalassobaculum sp.]|uniref:tetratricopeptide repeat protein n=1 Tax=Thalassobaculum sp. TaxID=2022740 RepID=UPI0032EE668E